MTVRELIEKLETLKPDQEIRTASYEFIGDFSIDKVEEREFKGEKYYCLDGD